MKVFYAPSFATMLKLLPEDARIRFLRQEDILRSNWRDPRLHLKKLKSKPITFSFRITRSYRALFYFRAFDEIVLFAIGHRKDIYR